MKKVPFSKTQFLLSALDAKQFPLLKNDAGNPLPEIAIIGRSNVGKSSLINHLLQDKKVAKTSATPGKTQALNFFLIDDTLLLVDLPGYGYAKITHVIKEKWGEVIDTYLEKRSSLSLLLFLLDIRRQPTEEDLSFLRWSTFYKKPVLLLFTKSDKVTDSEKQTLVKTSLKTLQETVGAPFDHMIYSIKDPRARKELVARLNQLLSRDVPWA
jgi:GTP-binding protein